MGQGAVDHVQQAEDDGELDEHGEASGGHGVVLPLVEGLDLLVHLLGVVLIFGLDLLHLGLDDLQLDGGLLLLDGQGDEQEFGDDGEKDDRHAVVVDDLVHGPHDIPQGQAKDGHDPLENIRHFCGSSKIGWMGFSEPFMWLPVLLRGVLQPGEGAEGEVLGDGVHPAPAEGVAAQDPADGHQAAPDQAEPP